MRILKSLFLVLGLTAPGILSASDTLVLDPPEGTANGKHIVLISGDEEYRTEESMPMLGKILSQHHGFKCTVLFSWGPDGANYIDPNNQSGLRGLEALDSADLMLIGTRFRTPADEDAVHITNFLNAGKPVIGIRTATHAFNGGQSFGGTLGFGEFGRKILGEQWVSHHGKHKKEGARAVIEEANGDHPILNGVEDIFAPSDVYGVKHLTDADTILLRGAITETLAPDSPNLADDPRNEPMQPLAWVHPYTAPDGETTGTSFCTTAGASVDLVNEDLRRMIVNAAHFLLELDVPDNAEVAYVDPFYPSFYGFIREEDYWKNADMQAEDYGMGQSPVLPDPNGSPEWPFRPTPAE